jgi:hypothetical protein
VGHDGVIFRIAARVDLSIIVDINFLPSGELIVRR